MAIRLLTAAPDIEAAQRMLREEIYSGATMLPHSVGYPGGSVDLDIAWHPELKFWAYIDDAESAYGPDGAGGRYWNVFGVQDPTVVRGSLSISVEINPPLEGANSRVAGVFGKDQTEALTLLHRGTIGGGRPGVGKDLFERQFQGKWTSVIGVDGFCAIVGTVGDPAFLTSLARFVEDVARMKSTMRTS